MNRTALLTGFAMRQLPQDQSLPKHSILGRATVQSRSRRRHTAFGRNNTCWLLLSLMLLLLLLPLLLLLLWL